MTHIRDFRTKAVDARVLLHEMKRSDAKKKDKKQRWPPFVFSHFKSLAHFVFMLVWAHPYQLLNFLHFVVLTFG